MKRILLAASVFLILAVNAQAYTIAGWDMAGLGTVTNVTGYGSDYATAYDMALGSGLTPYATSNCLNSTGWSDSDDQDYIEFGFSVVEGYEVTLSELWIGTKSSNTGPGTIGVYTSLDNYETAIYTISSGTSYSNLIIDLTSLGSITGDFYIRLFEIGNTQADGEGETYSGGTFRITDHYDSGIYTDVQFTGTVSASAVPLPSAFLLLGSGLMALATFRRKNG